MQDLTFKMDMDSGYFRGEISDFENKGKYWDVPFENANPYQFRKGSPELDLLRVNAIQNKIGPEVLRSDFNNYMLAVGLSEIERKTAEVQVMIILETNAMNRQYLEAEVIVLHNEGDRMLW